mgnify:CR=1 FL=1
MYTPIRVGKVFNDTHFGYTNGSTGGNISDKNKNFCELTLIRRNRTCALKFYSGAEI